MNILLTSHLKLQQDFKSPIRLKQRAPRGAPPSYKPDVKLFITKNYGS